MQEVSPAHNTTQASPQGFAPNPFEGTAYRAVARLAAGGMGEVFLVEQMRLGKRLAAKLLHSKLAGDARLLDRMRLEAETLGTIQHANIVTVFDFQSTPDGRPFVVMEYLKGRTLDAEIEICGPMTLEAALGFTAQLIGARGGPRTWDCASRHQAEQSLPV